jgi:predicted AAA+ superfamily ATPase
MIQRDAGPILIYLSQHYPVVVVAGPRQAGKSTLAKSIFPAKPYVSLEDLDKREFAQTDPRGFLKLYPDGAFIDEVQRCPDLLSYIQTAVDAKKQLGMFILTGSAQLTLLSAVSQSLAGRAALLNLLPFSIQELETSGQLPSTLEEVLFQGSYPPIYDRKLNSSDWYLDYIQTYAERDVRQILRIQDLGTFQRFLRLCAGRSGQLLNLTELGNDCGVSHSTAGQWINILEATYLVFRLQPYFKNYSKRLVKSSKLYFYDTGLLCGLLGIQSPSQLLSHPFRGAIFEGWVISEVHKHKFNQHKASNTYFWRDHKGLEVDLLMDQGEKIWPIEIKSGATIATDWFKSLEAWKSLAKEEADKGWLIYGGDDNQPRSQAEVLGWRGISKLLKNL